MTRETCRPPQSPLSISWLGEAKTAWAARRIAKARSSQAVAKALIQERRIGGSSKKSDVGGNMAKGCMKVCKGRGNLNKP